MTEQEKYMKAAIKQAKKAYDLLEVPIGCVIVHEGKIIGRGYNAEIQIKIRWPMQKSQRSTRQVKSLETGGWRDVPCM